MSMGSACVPAPPYSNSNFGCAEFPVFPCCEGISKGADLVHELNSPRRSCMEGIAMRRTTKGERGNLRAGVSRGARSPSRVRLPLTRRHETENRTPVISCYVFGNAAVCLGIRGDNRRFFSAHSPPAGHTLSEENALCSRLVTPLESAARSGLFAGRVQGNQQGEKALFWNLKQLILQSISPCKIFAQTSLVRRRSFKGLNAAPAGRTQANGQGLIALFRKLK
jgi:hypothetical protein